MTIISLQNVACHDFLSPVGSIEAKEEHAGEEKFARSPVKCCGACENFPTQAFRLVSHVDFIKLGEKSFVHDVLSVAPMTLVGIVHCFSC